MHVCRKYIIARATSLWRSLILINATGGRAGKLFSTGSEGLRATGLPCVITNHNKVKRTWERERGGNKERVIKFTLVIKRGTLYLAWNMQMKKGGKRTTRRRELLARSVIFATFFLFFFLKWIFVNE